MSIVPVTSIGTRPLSAFSHTHLSGTGHSDLGDIPADACCR